MSEPGYSETDFVEAVKRRQRASLIVTLVTTLVLVVAVGGFLAYSVSAIEQKRAELVETETRLATARDNLTQETTKLAEAQANRREAEDKLRDAQTSLAQVKPAAGNELSVQALSAARAILQVGAANPPQNGVPQAIAPRVYIHVRSADQAGVANQIAEKLKGQGMEVPRDQILTDVGPQNSELRFFKESDKDQGEQLLKLLAMAFPTLSWKINWVRGYEDSTSIRAKHFEVWLSPKAAL